MVKDILVGIAVGATMQAGVGAMFDRTKKYLAGLGDAIKANEQRAARIEAYRKLETRLGETQAAARAATERVAKLGAAMRKTTTPSKAMRQELGQARREAQRLTERVSEQTRAFGRQGRVLRKSGEDLDRLAERERVLGRVLDDQRRRRDHLAALMARQAGAREERGERRDRLIDTVALGYPLVRAVKSTIGAAVRFQSVMADERKVVDFETPAQFKGMGHDALELSTRLPVAAAGLGETEASMRPRQICRGMRGRSRTPRPRLRSASMRPRQICRGMGLASSEPTVRRSRFNEAPANLPGNVRQAVEHGPGPSRASMRPRQICRGMAATLAKRYGRSRASMRPRQICRGMAATLAKRYGRSRASMRPRQICRGM